MTEIVTVTGLKELREALVRKIPVEMQGKVLQKALADGTKVVVKAARPLAPKLTGRLKKAIYATRDRKNSKPTYEARVVTVRRGKKRDDPRGAFYWWFVEAGTKFQAAQPFLRPGFETSKRAALEAIITGLKKQIEKAAAKARF